MLNIKNPEAHGLAVEVAAVTGESLTEAVIVSLRERLDRVRPPRAPIDMEKVALILDQIAAAMPPEFFTEKDPTAFLYDDETGLPK